MNDRPKWIGDEEICVLQGLVKKGSSHASFSLSLDQLGQDLELKLECLQAYARPWDGEEPDSAGASWKMELQVNYDPPCWRSFSLGDFEKGERLLVKDLIERLTLEFENAARGPYFAFKDKLSISYANASKNKCLLVIPANWFVEFADVESAQALGFHRHQSVMVDIEETDHGSVRISNRQSKHPSAVLSGSFKKAVKASRAGRFKMTAGPVESLSRTSYEAAAPELSLVSVREWINKGLAELLKSVNLDIHLLSCASYTGSGRLQLVSNQSLGKIPLSAEISLSGKMAASLHEQTRTTRFHFGLGKHEALVRGLADTHELGSWRADNNKGAVPWSDPLQEIAPFYLVSDALEGGSYLSKTGNVSVVAIVGKSTRAQIAIPMKIRGRSGQINLRVLDSEMKECRFLQDFKFFIVFRMS